MSDTIAAPGATGVSTYFDPIYSDGDPVPPPPGAVPPIDAPFTHQLEEPHSNGHGAYKSRWEVLRRYPDGTLVLTSWDARAKHPDPRGRLAYPEEAARWCCKHGLLGDLPPEVEAAMDALEV